MLLFLGHRSLIKNKKQTAVIAAAASEPEANERGSSLISRRLLVSSVGRAPVCWAGGRGFEPQTGPTLRVLK